MASSSTNTPATTLCSWEREALRDTTWQFKGALQQFTKAEAEALILSHGGKILEGPTEIPTHTLAPGPAGTYFTISGNNRTGSIYEPGFINYIRSNAIGKRMNFARPGCLEHLVFAVLGTLPWLTIGEVDEIVKESGGALLRKGKRPKVPIEKPLDYVIVGEGADPADVEAARGQGIGVIDEQGLFNVVHDKDGIRTSRTGVTESRAEKFFRQIRGGDEAEESSTASAADGDADGNSLEKAYGAPRASDENKPEDEAVPGTKRKESSPSVVNDTGPAAKAEGSPVGRL